MAFNFDFDTPTPSSQVPVHVTGTKPGGNKPSYLRIAVTISYGGTGTASGSKMNYYRTIPFSASATPTSVSQTYNVAIVPPISTSHVVYTAKYGFAFTATGTYM